MTRPEDLRTEAATDEVDHRSEHDSAQGVDHEVAKEIAHEQAYVDRVYAELAKAATRAGLVEADGLARGRTDRTGDVRDEELTGLFERDALVFNAVRRRTTLESQYEGLVFGRLDLDQPGPAGEAREARYIGRLGVRDDEYEPLVIDWRAPAAAAFYRATPVEPMGVVRRRVLRCKGSEVIGVEDDLMVAEAPDDMVVVGDGALLAALTRSRGTQMRDIVATIQRHQDEAIRAQARGVTEITGGPGTGKTVVALHRAAYLLYSDRRRFESGGILVVGPSAAYTAYIERVLPSLGEESVTMRSLGDVVEGVTAVRLDSPAAAAVKGSLRMRRVLARAAHDAVPDAPTTFRAFVAGRAIRLDAPVLDRIRAQVLRNHHRNLATPAVTRALAEAAWATHREGERDEFLDQFEDHLEVEAFLRAWWPQVDAREVLLWMTDSARVRRYGQGVLAPGEAELLADSFATALETGEWSVADVALMDDLTSRLGAVQDEPAEERGFYEIEEYDDLAQYGVAEVRASRQGAAPAAVSHVQRAQDPRERLLHGRIGGPEEYAHVLVDEAQDLSPMQWRMLGRRGRYSSWTVVGDAAQASWPDAAEANPGPVGGLRVAGAPAVPHGHELPQRPRDLRLRRRGRARRGAGRRHPGGRARDRRAAGGGHGRSGDAARGRAGRGRPLARRGRGLDRRRDAVRAHHWPGRPRGRRVGPGAGHRPDVDQGSGVRRHGHRRPRRDHRRVARWGARPVRRPDPRRAPHVGRARPVAGRDLPTAGRVRPGPARRGPPGPRPETGACDPPVTPAVTGVTQSALRCLVRGMFNQRDEAPLGRSDVPLRFLY